MRRATYGCVTVYHVYDGDQCVADVDGSGNLLLSYTWGVGIDNLLAVTVHGAGVTNSYYAVKDHLNSIYALVDDSGDTVLTVSYDAWGKPLNSSFSIHNSSLHLRYLFQGCEYSVATGLYNFRARWHSPDIGRWLSCDPIGLEGGLNLYEFCGNNPVNFIDPWGYEVYYSDLGETHSILVYSDPSSSTGYRKFGFEGEGAGHPQDTNTRRENLRLIENALLTKGVLQLEEVIESYKDDLFIKLDLFCSEEEKLRDAIKKTEPGLYCAPFRNCSHVVRNVLNKSGYLSKPLAYGTIIEPEDLTKELEERNRARNDRRKWKENLMRKIKKMKEK